MEYSEADPRKRKSNFDILPENFSDYSQVESYQPNNIDVHLLLYAKQDWLVKYKEKIEKFMNKNLEYVKK